MDDLTVARRAPVTVYAEGGETGAAIVVTTANYRGSSYELRS